MVYYRNKTQVFFLILCVIILLLIYRLLLLAVLNIMDNSCAKELTGRSWKYFPLGTFATSGKLIMFVGIYGWKQGRVNLAGLISCEYRRTVGVPNSQVCLVAMLTADISHKIAWKVLLRICRLETLMWMGHP